MTPKKILGRKYRKMSSDIGSKCQNNDEKKDFVVYDWNVVCNRFEIDAIGKGGDKKLDNRHGI